MFGTWISGLCLRFLLGMYAFQGFCRVQVRQGFLGGRSGVVNPFAWDSDAFGVLLGVQVWVSNSNTRFLVVCGLIP